MPRAGRKGTNWCHPASSAKTAQFGGPLAGCEVHGILAYVRPIHLSRLRIPGGDVDDLARLHAEWALGLERFESLRAQRLAAGVPPETMPADLVDGQARQWTFKFTLPEQNHVVRTSAIKISNHGSETSIEHLVVRDGRPDLLKDPSAAAPEVVGWLLDNIEGIQPAALRQREVRRVDEADVAAFVDEVLSPNRVTPQIVVSVENATRSPALDTEELAQRLTGMAAVYRLVSVHASYRLRDELTSRGMSDKFGCYNGGVRIYWPGLGASDNPYDHLLLLLVRLLSHPPRARAEHVAGTFCELIAEGEDPRRWLRDLDAPPRPPPPKPVTIAPERPRAPEPPRPHEQPSAEPPAADTPRPSEALRPLQVAPALAQATPSEAPQPGPDEAPSPSSVAEPPRPVEAEPPTSLPELAPVPASEPTSPSRAAEAIERGIEPGIEPEPEMEQLEPARPIRTRGRSTWTALADDVVAALQLADELEHELAAMRSELSETRKELRRAQQERDELEGAFGPPRSVADALARAEAMFSDRLVVVRSARVSADNSPYREPGRVFFVLSLLANCDSGSIGDVLTKALGGKARWKPKDSPETEAKFGKARTWTDSTGIPKLFSRHVTVGHGVNPQKCLQIYYDVLGDGRIEVAWCGEHRPTVSEDT